MTATTVESEAAKKTTRKTLRRTVSQAASAEEKDEIVSIALAEAKQRVEKHLRVILQARSKGEKKGEKGACEPLGSAMYEGLLAGGKRMRPFLLFASAALAEAVSAQEKRQKDRENREES